MHPRPPSLGDFVDRIEWPAISIFLPQLFTRGVALLLLGILSFFGKEIAGESLSFYETSLEQYLEDWEKALFLFYIIALFVLAVIVLYLFCPLLN